MHSIYNTCYTLKAFKHSTAAAMHDPRAPASPSGYPETSVPWLIHRVHQDLSHALPSEPRHVFCSLSGIFPNAQASNLLLSSCLKPHWKNHTPIHSVLSLSTPVRSGCPAHSRTSPQWFCSSVDWLPLLPNTTGSLLLCFFLPTCFAVVSPLRTSSEAWDPSVPVTAISLTLSTRSSSSNLRWTTEKMPR